jgi:hypothetical protein
MQKTLFTLFLALSLTGFMALSIHQALASESDDLEKQARLLNKIAEQNEKDDRVFEVFAEQLGIEGVDAATLKEQLEATNLSYGNLFIANALAKSSSKSFDEISDEFLDGKGWGIIAQENGIKLGSLISELKRSNQAMEHAQNRIRNEEGTSEGQQNRVRNEEGRSRGQQMRTRPSNLQRRGSSGGRGGR